MKFFIPHSVIVKSPGLLPMLYKTCELAEDLNIPPRTLYDWLKNGAPHHRDQRDHIWINGQEFAGWVISVRRKQTEKLQENEGFCLRCKQSVEITNPRIVQEPGSPSTVKGTCPKCQGKVLKGTRSNGQPG
jgi:hypothetical protein